MNQKDAGAKPMREDEIPATHVNVAIICDNWETGANAYALLQRAVNRAGGVGLARVWLCHLNELALSATAGASLDQAVGAHLILLALRSQSKAPTGLLDWLGKWAARREVQDAALALFDDEEGEMPFAAAMPEIAEFARRNGLTLIFGNRHSSEDDSVPLGLGMSKKGLVTAPELQGTTDFTECHHYRCFGINE